MVDGIEVMVLKREFSEMHMEILYMMTGIYFKTIHRSRKVGWGLGQTRWATS